MNEIRRLLLNGQVYDCQPEETILDALLRKKIEVPYSCRKQQCMSCMMRCLNGVPPAASQINMKQTLKTQNNFLACSCFPDRDMEIALPSESILYQVNARVADIHRLSPKVMELSLECETPLDYHAGQSVVIMNSSSFGKRFPIVSPTSVKGYGRYEVHVGLITGGFFSEWVHNQLQAGEKITLSGVSGELFYIPGRPEKPMLLAAWNGNLGALMAIVQDAIENNHSGTIFLFHGVSDPDYLYWRDEISEISQYYPNFHFLPCVENGHIPTGCYDGLLTEAVKSQFSSLEGWSVYIYGDRERVLQLQTMAYLVGAATKEIYREVTEI